MHGAQQGWPQVRPGALWRQALEANARARACGELEPIATELHTVEEGGVPYPVRVLGRIERKERQGAALRSASPFLEPPPSLVVGTLSATHALLLNKFPVVQPHLLVVTRAFEEQEGLLGAADFHALALCLAELDGLAFYNAGPSAGASQRHRHLQLIAPLGPAGLRAPIERVLGTPPQGRAVTVRALPFAHVTTGLGLSSGCLAVDGVTLHEAYRALRRAAGFSEARHAYNLLATRRWMLLVPRRAADWEGINLNAMGFAGSLLVRDKEQLARVREAGPGAVLAAVAGDRTFRKETG
jgi:sulfate adenylyltransferase (ADP) / ATP adenylyltransferase